MAPLTVHGDPKVASNVSDCHTVWNATATAANATDAAVGGEAGEALYGVLSADTKEEIYYGLLSANIALAVVGTLLLAAVYFGMYDVRPGR